MATHNNKDFQIQERSMRMRAKGYNNTYRCTLVGTTSNHSKCNHPLFHLSMLILIASSFYLAVTTKYQTEYRDPLLVIDVAKNS